MLKNIKKLFASSLLLGLFLVPLLVPAAASAQPSIEEGLCKGVILDVSDSGTGCADDVDAESKVNGLIELIINIFSIVVGVVSVIMIIIGGLKYITSSGDSNNVQSAKNTILYAIIGLVIVALAQIIVRFVLSKALSSDA